MNREIKFRGWTLQMYKVEGLLAKKGVDYYISNLRQMPHAYLVRPETIGQYTGLKDKNGVEVFEGDLIRYYYKDCDNDLIEVIFEVKYIHCSFRAIVYNENSSFKIGADLGIYEDINYEVVGNIHENKELL